MYHARSNLPCSRYTNEIYVQARSGRAKRATLLVSFNKNITRSGSCHNSFNLFPKPTEPAIYISIGFHVYGMHYIPPIDLSLTHNTIMSQLNNLFWSHFLNFFSDDNACTFHFCCPCSKCVYSCSG